ncbi:hypothetical protein HGG67_05275 [Rhodobacteraceae bacterium R_SAG8]|nr:hypothetical protein [Rhodobacteraceae bacterium R_SAG8]QLL44040.1 hypothetical protein G6548_14965 [Sulfitobacter pontiacus]ULO21966.1 hypothetical protein IV89_003318 [Sulfitobacter sp. CB2047]HBM41826.1 hypothetical protein [Sulfitobacter sp.]
MGSNTVLSRALAAARHAALTGQTS